MSPGIPFYYFKNKDEVLFWMVPHANRVITNLRPVAHLAVLRQFAGRAGLDLPRAQTHDFPLLSR